MAFTNGGFETGGITGWTPVGSPAFYVMTYWSGVSLFYTPQDGGTYFLVLASDGNPGSVKKLTQDEYFYPGDTITAKVAFDNADLVEDFAALRIRQGSTLISTVWLDGMSGESGPWVDVSWQCTVEGTYTIELSCENTYDSNYESYALFDAFVITRATGPVVPVLIPGVPVSATSVLTKDFIAQETTLPDKVVSTFFPATSYIERISYGLDPYNKLRPAHTVSDSNNDGSASIGDSMLYLDEAHSFGTTTISKIVTNTVTLPARFENVWTPGFTVVSYLIDYGWNSSAISTTGLNGDGEASFQVPALVSGVVCGLNTLPLSLSNTYVDIEYGLYFSHGMVQVIERGNLITTPVAYTDANVFTIYRWAGQIGYAKDNSVFHVSTKYSTGALLLDCSIYGTNDSIQFANFSAAQSVVPHTYGTANLAPVQMFGGTGSFSGGAVTLAPITVVLIEHEAYGGDLKALPIKVFGGTGPIDGGIVYVEPAVVVGLSSNGIPGGLAPAGLNGGKLGLHHATCQGVSSAAIVPTICWLEPATIFGSNYALSQGIVSVEPAVCSGISYGGSPRIYKHIRDTYILSSSALIRTIHSEHYTVSSRWITDIVYLINLERAAAGKSQISAYTGPISKDIAEHHSNDMKDSTIYAHEDQAFPATYRLFTERAAHVPKSIYSSENIQIISVNDESFLDINTVSPDYAHAQWKASPTHYDNYMQDFPVGASTQMMLGVAFRGSVSNILGWENEHHLAWLTQVFVNFGNKPRTGFETLQTRGISDTYDLTPCFLRTISCVYSLDAYSHLSIRHKQPYSIKVAKELVELFGTRVAIESLHPISYNLKIESTHTYGSTVIVKVSNSQSYDLKINNSVKVSSTRLYSIKISKYSAHLYSSPSIKVSNKQIYSFTVVLPVVVSSSHIYSLRHSVIKSCSQIYGDIYSVKQSNSQIYDLKNTDPIKLKLTQFYNISGDSFFVHEEDSITVWVGNKEIDIEAISLNISEGDYVWNTNFTLADSDQAVLFVKLCEFYVFINKGTIDEESWIFLMDTKSISRDTYGSISVKITGYSSAILLGEPYSEQVDYSYNYPILMSDLADIIIPGVSWNVLDWTLPAFRFGIKNSTPIKALDYLASAVDGVILSNPDGSLLVQSKFPVKLKNYPTCSVDHVFADFDDNLSSMDEGDISDEKNKFRIIETNDIFADTIEFEANPDNPKIGILKVFPNPWRNTIKVVSTKVGGVTITPIGNVSFDLTEQIDFINGEASLSKPGIFIKDVTWLSDSLGTIFLEPRTTKITVPTNVNYGYGVASITYSVEALEYSVVSLIDVGQFLVLDEDEIIL